MALPIGPPPEDRERWTRTCDCVSEAGVLLFVALVPFLHVDGPLRLLYRHALIVAAVAFCVRWALAGRALLPRSPVLPTAVLFVAVSAASALLARDLLASLGAFSKYGVRGAAACVLVAAVFRDAPRQRRLAAALAWSALAFAGASTVLFLWDVRNPWGGFMGFEIDYNSLCMWLLPTLPFVLALALAYDDRRTRAAWLLAAAGLLFAILMSFSRVGWVAAGAGLTLWAWLVPQGRRPLGLVAAIAVAAFLVLGPSLGNARSVTDNTRFLREERLDVSVMKQMSWQDVFTMNDRLVYAWRPALDQVRRRPWLGAGYGPSTFAALTRGNVLLGHEHNLLLAVGVQSGLLGVVAAAAFVAVVLWRSWAGLRAETGLGLRRLLHVAVFVAVVAEYLIQGLGEPNLNTRMGILFFVLAGLTAALDDDSRRASASG